MSQGPKVVERRWIILAQGLAGWLAALDGSYWSRRRVPLAPVQMLGDSATLSGPPPSPPSKPPASAPFVPSEKAGIAITRGGRSQPCPS